MSSIPPGEITLLLSDTENPESLDRLFQFVYGELRQIAGAYLRKGWPDQSLQTTELVHEAYLRLFGGKREYKSRKHFFAAAAEAMRWILIDKVRRNRTEKRGGHMERVDFDHIQVLAPENAGQWLALDQALKALDAHDQGLRKLVELRVFAGLTEEEIAEVLDMPRATVGRHWRLAKAWLQREIDRYLE